MKHFAKLAIPLLFLVACCGNTNDKFVEGIAKAKPAVVEILYSIDYGVNWYSRGTGFFIGKIALTTKLRPSFTIRFQNLSNVGVLLHKQNSIVKVFTQ